MGLSCLHEHHDTFTFTFTMTLLLNEDVGTWHRLVLKDDALREYPVRSSYRDAVSSVWPKRKAEGRQPDLEGCLRDIGRRYFLEGDWHTIKTRPKIAHMARNSCTLHILMPVHRMQVQALSQHLMASLVSMSHLINPKRY